MPSWNSRGLRGSTLEELVNLPNEKYRMNRLALIQKIPTPIKPIRIDPENRHITLAYFEQKSTVDYIGVVQGIPVCFDAKECAAEAFPVANVHAHQIEFMEEFEQQKGIAFILLYFSKRNVFHYLPFAELKRFWERAQNGGKKSFRYEELDPSYTVGSSNGVFVHYLEALSRDLTERNI